MKCIILCAGYGTRLYPLTLDRPKPLLTITGKPLLEYIIEKIEKLESIKEILIVTNNKFFDNFKNWRKNCLSKKPIKILNDGTNSDEDKLGAVGDIKFAIEKEKIEDNVLIVAGDNLFEFDLIKLFDFFEEKKDSVVALYDIQDKEIAAGKYGIVEIDQNNKVINFEEKPLYPKTTLVSTACYILTPGAIEELQKSFKDGKRYDNIGDFLKWLINRKNLFGLAFEEKWIDIGSYGQLKEAELRLA